METESHQEKAERKSRSRMAAIDDLPIEIRKLVHEYGWHVVNTFMLNGVTNPRRIKHLVETVLDDFSPTRGSFSCQGKRSSAFDDTDGKAANAET